MADLALSIVATMYESEPFLDEFHRRATAAAASRGGSFELILVNDGSPDGSLAKAKALQRADPRVRVVDLSRNFGHHKAIMVGLGRARGRRIFLIDCDLEESPEWLEPFWREMDERGCDVVFGVQERRKGRLFERWSGELFWRAFNLMTRASIPPNAMTVRLMSRRYVDALLGFQESELFLGGVLQQVGFDQRPLVVHKRGGQRTTYTLARKLALFTDAVTSFSAIPLNAIFYFGMTIAAAAFAATLCMVALKFAAGRQIELGWTSLIVSIWFLSGVLMTFLGVIGIYLSRVFMEVKRRPWAIVRETFEAGGVGERESG